MCCLSVFILLFTTLNFKWTWHCFYLFILRILAPWIFSVLLLISCTNCHSTVKGLSRIVVIFIIRVHRVCWREGVKGCCGLFFNVDYDALHLYKESLKINIFKVLFWEFTKKSTLYAFDNVDNNILDDPLMSCHCVTCPGAVSVEDGRRELEASSNSGRTIAHRGKGTMCTSSEQQPGTRTGGKAQRYSQSCRRMMTLNSFLQWCRLVIDCKLLSHIHYMYILLHFKGLFQAMLGSPYAILWPSISVGH